MIFSNLLNEKIYQHHLMCTIMLSLYNWNESLVEIIVNLDDPFSLILCKWSETNHVMIMYVLHWLSSLINTFEHMTNLVRVINTINFQITYDISDHVRRKFPHRLFEAVQWKMSFAFMDHVLTSAWWSKDTCTGSYMWRTPLHELSALTRLCYKTLILDNDELDHSIFKKNTFLFLHMSLSHMWQVVNDAKSF